ncbi:MAG: BufA2 family periplasmic bufferin-type metallophore [Burkholderiales bacterium]
MDERKRNTMRAVSGAALAVVAAGLFLNGSAGVRAADTKEAKVHCAGVNACKGKSECSSAKNSCSGQNACKGQGWVSMTEKQCLDKGGKVEKS